MEHKVTIANLQQSFMAQENETLLEAAIRAGVSLNYGCSSGTCGLCKVQLVSGEVSELRTHEYVLCEAEKLQRYILACACAAKQAPVVNAPVATTAKDIPQQLIRVKVRKVEHLTEQIYNLVVQTPRTNRLRFLAGQSVEIGDDKIGRRRFPIASCPCEDRRIELHIRDDQSDPVTRVITQSLRQGDSLDMHGPYGDFIYDENANRPLVLFAFDTGFAAINSLLEHITAQEQELGIHLIWMACDMDGLYMNNLCRSWQDAFDGFTYSGIALDQSLQQLSADMQQSCQLIENSLIEVMRCHDSLMCHDVYTCAPAPVIEVFKSLCQQKGMLATRFFAQAVEANAGVACITVDK